MNERKLLFIAASGWGCSAILLRRLWKAYQAEIANQKVIELATQIVTDAKFVDIIRNNDL